MLLKYGIEIMPRRSHMNPMRSFSMRSFSALLASLLLALTLSAKPQVVQELTGLTNPVSCIYSPDGSSLYIVNKARGDAGMIRERSYVSKYSVSPEGTLKLYSKQFISRLTAATDLDFAPVNFATVPVGSIFIVAGSPLIQNEAGQLTKDATNEFIGIVVANPETGETLKRIHLGPGSDLLLKTEFPLISPSSLAFDKAGNLYIADTGIGGYNFKERFQGRPVIYRLEPRAVLDLLTGVPPVDVDITRISSLPGDMTYDRETDTIYFISNHIQGAPSGSVSKFESGNYKGLASQKTIVRGLVALNGLHLTPKGRVLLLANTGEVLFPRGRKASRTVRIHPQVTFSTPGKIDLMQLEDGHLLVPVPEENSDAGLGKGQTIKVVRLPPGY